jgi:hypothetical protein
LNSTKHPLRKKEVEINFIEDDSNDLFIDAHLNVSNFFVNVDEKVNIMN